MNPFAQSSRARRRSVMWRMISSGTSRPASMIPRMALPRSVPALSSSRSRSPVDICGMRSFSPRRLACVPLPDPCGPIKMIFMCAGSPRFMWRGVLDNSWAKDDRIRCLRQGVKKSRRATAGDFEDAGAGARAEHTLHTARGPRIGAAPIAVKRGGLLDSCGRGTVYSMFELSFLSISGVGAAFWVLRRDGTFH